MRNYLLTFTFIVFALFSWDCQKTYTLAPVPPGSIPTATQPPCGFPGNTCTFTPTSTATSTSTPTSSPTITRSPTPTLSPTITLTPTVTLTPTSTPLVISPPQGAIGWLDTATGYPNITWIVDPSSAVTAYEVWGSTTGLPGSYADLATYVKTVGVDFMSVVDNQTVFNAYFYVVAIGTLPDSAPSRIVHAVSGTTTTNALTISVTSSLSPTISVTGSVTGAFMRAYTIPQVPPVYYWVWGDEGSPLTTSVVYGFSGSGLTYVPEAGLPASTNNIPLTIRTYNSQYWNIDTSYTTFNTP